MKKYNTLLIEKDSQVTTITLNRPHVFNAFNEVMMEEIADALRDTAKSATRLIIISASGTNFCAGADLEWMKSGSSTEQKGTKLSSEVLKNMYAQFRLVSCPVVSRVFGKVFAGGVGICAASDVVYAEEDTVFCISEARVGLIPAVMSPFVVERIGVARFRELVLTARKFSASEALEMGLVNFVLPKTAADSSFNDSIQSILKNGPEALAATKLLCRKFMPFDWENKSHELTNMLTERRTSAEGQEGTKAFLEKRPPKWLVTK